MHGAQNYPKLRWPIDLRIEKIEKDEVLLINCPLGISKAPLALIAAVAPIVACMEGNLSFQQILDRFTAQGLTAELLQNLITLLDDHLFLANARFFEAQAKMHENFTLAESRPAALAGLSYASSSAQLELEVDSYLAHAAIDIDTQKRKLVGLVSPHIDYRRGAVAYGKTYHHLRDDKPDLYILIGTAHQYSKHMFHLCAKDFESPLGILRCDRDFISKLANFYGEQRSFADEILHRKEHSLELQVPFIRRLHSSPTIAPILVGSFHNILLSGKRPQNFEQYEKFAESLTAALNSVIAAGRRPCIVAGVDMAHIGMYFGDKEPLNAKRMEKIEERDRAYLKCIENQDKSALFEHIAEDMDERRICGFPTMYTVLDVLDRLAIKYESKLYDYRQAVDYKNDCAVTFAGLGLYSKS